MDQLIQLTENMKKTFKMPMKILGEKDKEYSFKFQVLGFAIIPLKKDNTKFNMKEQNWPDSGYTFVGLLGLMDPPKPGVNQAIATCRSAGIRVFMITGDHPIT